MWQAYGDPFDSGSRRCAVLLFSFATHGDFMRFAKLFSSLVLFSASAVAVADSGLYLGAGLTRAEVDSHELSDADESYKAYAGYRLNDYLSFEGALVDFGDLRDGHASFSGQSAQANVHLGLPLGRRLRVYGIAGVHAWRSDDGDVSGDKEDMDALYGFGAELDIIGGLGVRLEQETLKVGDLDVDQTSASAYWRF